MTTTYDVVQLLSLVWYTIVTERYIRIWILLGFVFEYSGLNCVLDSIKYYNNWYLTTFQFLRVTLNNLPSGLMSLVVNLL